MITNTGKCENMNETWKMKNDKEKMEKVDSHGSQETKQLFGERKIKWRLENLIENGEYEKKALIRLPDDMKNLFGDHDIQNGSVSMDILKAKACNYQPQEDDMTALMKARIEHLLRLVDREKIDPSKSLLVQYEEALSVNKKGYSVHYKRDTDEIMVNTYNPEWITAWNGNMVELRNSTISTFESIVTSFT